MQSDFAVERRENSPPLHRKERPETCKISLVLTPSIEARDFQHIEIIIHVQVWRSFWQFFGRNFTIMTRCRFAPVAMHARNDFQDPFQCL